MRTLRFWLLNIGLTCLIWSGADQFVTMSEVITVPIQIVPSAPSVTLVRLADGERLTVQITFRGPNQSVNKLVESKSTLTAKLEIKPRDPGGYTLDLVDEFRTQMDQFPEGLTITETDPAGVSIDVDKYVQKRVAVVLDDAGMEFDGAPLLDPSEVTITVPQKQFEGLSPEQRVLVISAERAFQGAIPGRPVHKQIPLPKELSGIPLAEVLPPRITLSATLKSLTEELTIPTVAIRILTSGEMIDQYRVILDGQERPAEPVTRAITIRGPVDLLRAIADDPAGFQIIGFLNITRADALRGDKPFARTPEFINLPVGVELVQDAEPVQVQLLPIE